MIHNHEEWLQARLKGIGASEASAIIGCNPYMSNVDLWRLKTGRKQAQDISSNAHVQYGHDAEGPLRELFALDYPQYVVSYGGAVRDDDDRFEFPDGTVVHDDCMLPYVEDRYYHRG